MSRRWRRGFVMGFWWWRMWMIFISVCFCLGGRSRVISIGSFWCMLWGWWVGRKGWRRWVVIVCLWNFCELNWVISLWCCRLSVFCILSKLCLSVKVLLFVFWCCGWVFLLMLIIFVLMIKGFVLLLVLLILRKSLRCCEIFFFYLV